MKHIPRKSPDVVLTIVCEQFNITLSSLYTSRFQSAATPRKGAYWVLRQHGYSYPEIARIMKRVNHTTVLHGFRKAEGLRRDDQNFRNLTDLILEETRAKFTDD